MKLKKICYMVSAALALCLAQSALAWPDDGWTGLANDGLWSSAANWSSGLVPGATTDDANASVQIDTANGWSVVTIPATETVTVNGSYSTIYGPEYGAGLNIYGSLSYVWMMAPGQTDPSPGNRTIINMYDGSSLQTPGAGLGIGYAWWWWYDAPFVTLNMYGSAQVHVPYLALGGHANVYDTASITVTNALFTGSVGAVSTGTASLVLGGGTVKLPTGQTNAILSMVGSGVIRAYGKGMDTNDLVITDDGANSIVTTVPLGGALQRVYFQPLLRTNVAVGTFQQATLVGDYPSITGVLLSSAEPGLNPASFTHPVYTSSNTNVVRVDTNGLVTAIGVGSSILTATVGAFTSTNSVSLIVTQVNATLVHRYSFTSDASDSVGGTDWNGTLEGSATISNGKVVLDGATNNLVLGDGVASYVLLPAGILSNLDEVTIEVWASFNVTTTNNYENLFAFGYSDVDSLSTTYEDGGNYIIMEPHTGSTTATISFGQGLPGNNGNRDAGFDGVLDGQANMQIVAVFHPLAGYEALYTNGVLAASSTMFNNLIDPVAATGPTYSNKSILATTLGADEFNYIGASLYGADPNLSGSINEFRIYNGPLTAGQILANYALGPDQLIGTVTNVSLTASISGTNVLVTWPTNSALVTLMSSSALGSSASWSAASGSLVVAGGKYQMTVPATATAQFFRLQK